MDTHLTNFREGRRGRLIRALCETVAAALAVVAMSAGLALGEPRDFLRRISRSTRLWPCGGVFHDHRQQPAIGLEVRRWLREREREACSDDKIVV